MLWKSIDWFLYDSNTGISWVRRFQEVESHSIKSALTSLKQFLASESPLKMTKNAFYFTLKALLVLKKFKFLSWFFGDVEKRLD